MQTRSAATTPKRFGRSVKSYSLVFALTLLIRLRFYQLLWHLHLPCTWLSYHKQAHGLPVTHWLYIRTQAVWKTSSVCAAASASQNQSCSAHGSWKATWKRTRRTWQRTPSRFFRQRAAALWCTCGNLYEMEVLYRGKQNSSLFKSY